MFVLLVSCHNEKKKKQKKEKLFNLNKTFTNYLTATKSCRSNRYPNSIYYRIKLNRKLFDWDKMLAGQEMVLKWISSTCCPCQRARFTYQTLVFWHTLRNNWISLFDTIRKWAFRAYVMEDEESCKEADGNNNNATGLIKTTLPIPMHGNGGEEKKQILWENPIFRAKMFR